MPTYTTQQIADRVGGRLIGRADLAIRGVDGLETAGPDRLTFIRDAKHAASWPRSQAGAALVWEGAGFEPGAGRALIRVKDTDLSLAVVLEMFAPPPARPAPGIHPWACADPTASLGQNVSIGPGCYVGPRARIGRNCVLHSRACVYDDATIGDGCELHAGVVVRERCELGRNVVVHANAVIGSDGFGYRPAPDGSRWVKIPQIGSVKIGDDVEIGAGTCIDRGKFAATTIGEGTKIDNLCQIAHNCRIGRRCILAGQVGLAGSVTLGDEVILGGQVGVADHIRIGAGARVGAKSGVMHDIPAGETWMGQPAQERGVALRQAATLRRLLESIRTQAGRLRPNASSERTEREPL